MIKYFINIGILFICNIYKHSGGIAEPGYRQLEGYEYINYIINYYILYNYNMIFKYKNVV